MKNEKDRKINVEQTIQNILNHKKPYTFVDEQRLREEVRDNEKLLVEAAVFVRVEIVYEN